MTKAMLKGSDLLTLAELSPDDLRAILDRASSVKTAWRQGTAVPQPSGRAAALVFMKPSLRTRVSFEVALARMGMHPISLGPKDAFSRGETVSDTVKVLERYVDVIVARTFEQSLLTEIADAASVPVVSALSDDYHPCQVLADLLTIEEAKGKLEGVRFAYVGDGNNMANTYLIGGALAGMEVRVATPPGFEPLPEAVDRARSIGGLTGASVMLSNDPGAAVEGADVVATDTWASMGQEAEHAARVAAFAGWTVDGAMMAHTAEDVIFLHCLPAHRGEEVTDEVIDAGYSAVFDEAENRLHAQQALLELLLG